MASLLQHYPVQKPFEVRSPFKPTGDQPQAIEQLTRDLAAGAPAVCLLGATGTGKTFTMANVIARLNKPTLIISHNKTLAAQLYEEMKELFPENSVNYFVSYYDYYQPEAYIPQRDIYIEKDSSRNDELDQLRLAATSNILSRRDTIVVASVSCIFGLGSPQAYGSKVLTITKGSTLGSAAAGGGGEGGAGGGNGRRAFLLALNGMQYQRSEIEFKRGQYRVRGDSLEIWPAYEKYAVRVELFGDQIERIELINPISGELLAEEKQFFLFPAVHYVTREDTLAAVIASIRAEMDARVMQLRSEGKLLEAQRLLARTKYDLEMIEEVGFCNGIENYSRFFDGRMPGERPYTLMDYFDFAPPAATGRDAALDAHGGEHAPIPAALAQAAQRPNYKDWLLIIDESHVTIPQVGGMFQGDRSRKTTLVEHGFRLPCALDNRPLTFAEFEMRLPTVLHVSATPGPWEREKAGGISAEQVVRPTGIVDPPVVIRPARHQVDDLLGEVRLRTARHERVLVTTLTKRMAEELTEHFADVGVKVRYLHSDVTTLERAGILKDLRLGVFDVLVGINLLREGLDLPEVSLVAVLDADREGFLRSETSLIQTSGRAARNVHGTVIFYADTETASMTRALSEMERRRKHQRAYNLEHHITPTSVVRGVRATVAEAYAERDYVDLTGLDRAEADVGGDRASLERRRADAEKRMREAAKAMKFEEAAKARDEMRRLDAELLRLDAI